MRIITPNQIATCISNELENIKLGNAPVELYEPIRYLLALGGKRLRPQLALMSYAMYKTDFEKIVQPALAIEVFHNFTLMHDDIMDNAPVRRGKPTVHEKWTNNVAILSGDVMLVKAYDLLLAVEDKYFKQIIYLFNKTAAEVCEGQQFDMNFEKINNVTADEYLRMIELKTAVLLGFSLQMGALLADATPQEAQKLYDFGVNIGIGFQLKDDLLDVYGDKEKFGKQVGGDIVANKKTYLLIKALALAKGDTQKELNRLLSLTTFDKDEKVKAVTDIYNQLGIQALTENLMNEYFEKAFAIFKTLDRSEEQKSLLYEFAKALIERES
jgi:geranylgeranyl diphosphate synthase type II